MLDTVVALYGIYLRGGYDNACDFWDDVEAANCTEGLSRKQKRTALYKYLGAGVKLLGEFELRVIFDKLVEGDYTCLDRVKKSIEAKQAKQFIKDRREAMDLRFSEVFGLKVVEVK